MKNLTFTNHQNTNVLSAYYQYLKYHFNSAGTFLVFEQTYKGLFLYTVSICLRTQFISISMHISFPVMSRSDCFLYCLISFGTSLVVQIVRKVRKAKMPIDIILFLLVNNFFVIVSIQFCIISLILFSYLFKLVLSFVTFFIISSRDSFRLEDCIILCCYIGSLICLY